MRWIYLTVTVIPTLLGMIVTLMILSILVGPPQIKFGGGPPSIVVDNAYITKDPSGKFNAVVIQLHNPGGGKALIIGIKINNKLLAKGPSFSRPLVIEGGVSTSISYIIPSDIKPVKNRYNITLIYAPETGGGVYSTSVIIPATTPSKAG